MPHLAEQHTRMQGFTAVFTVLRLLTPLKMSYEAAKKRAEPYTQIVEEIPQMQRETVHLVRQAVSEGRHAYVLVNNRSEGNAPLTVQALAECYATRSLFHRAVNDLPPTFPLIRTPSLWSRFPSGHSEKEGPSSLAGRADPEDVGMS